MTKLREPNLNAYKHGLTGQTLVLEPADKPAYDEHCKSYADLYKPVGRPEEILVRMIADDYWRALRGRALETALMSRIMEHNELLTLDAEEEKMLRNIALYLQRIERSIRNNTQALKEMQSERKSQPAQQDKPQARTATASPEFVFSPPLPEPAISSTAPPPSPESTATNAMKAA